MDNLQFDIKAILANPTLAAIFNEDIVKFDAGLFACARENQQTYNGIMIHCNNPDDEWEVVWDAIAFFDIKEKTVRIRGGKEPGGGNGGCIVNLLVNAEGQTILHDHPNAKTLTLGAIYVEPATQEAYDKIKEVFGAAVFDSAF